MDHFKDSHYQIKALENLRKTFWGRIFPGLQWKYVQGPQPAKNKHSVRKTELILSIVSYLHNTIIHN